MNTKQRSIVILILIAAASLGITSVYSADSPILQAGAEDVYLRAGQENTITIVLKNTGDYKIFDVESFLVSEVPGITVVLNANMVIPEILADKSKRYEAVLYVDPSVALGAYSISLTVTYGRTGSSLQGQVTVPIGVVVAEAFTPSIIYTPRLDRVELVSGAVREAEFGFTNIGDDAVRNLEIVLSSATSSITLTDHIVTNITELAPGEYFSIKPHVSIMEGTPLGQYTIMATASYLDPDGNKIHQTFYLPINVASAEPVRTTLVTLESMQVVEEKIIPGDLFTIEITISCSGADAYDLLSRIEFDPTSRIASISPSVVDLGDLAQGNTTKVRYRLLASGDIPAGQYPLTTTITYTNNRGAKQTLTETMTILVDPLVEFDLLDISSEKTPPGGRGELDADLLLIGTEGVEFVSVNVVEDDVVKRVSGSDEYIGAIDPDSPIPFDIAYQIDEDAEEGPHTLWLNVTYRDHLNKEHAQMISLRIDIGKTINEGTVKPQNPIWIWIRRLLGLGP